MFFWLNDPFFKPEKLNPKLLRKPENGTYSPNGTKCILSYKKFVDKFLSITATLL